MLTTLPRYLTATTLIGLVTLGTACSTSDTPAGGTAEATTAASAAPQPGSQGGERSGAPGVSGLIAEVTDHTMQVQGRDGQTAVTWSATTTLTKRATGTLADITVGVCVTGTGAVGADSSSTEVTRLTVSPAQNGTCPLGLTGGAAGTRGDGQGSPSGMPSGMPSAMPDGVAPDGGPGTNEGAAPGDTPSAMPSGQPDGAGRGGMVAGLVTAVEGSSITVEQTGLGSGGNTTSTFTIGSDATVSTTVAATVADVVVDTCVSAQGKADDTGAVTATSLIFSEPTDGQCDAGLR